MTSALRSFGLSLPDYPWEAMAPYLAKAAEHPGGAVNLSIGTPVDATPDGGPGGPARSSQRPRLPHGPRHGRRSGKPSRRGLNAAAACPGWIRRTSCPRWGPRNSWRGSRSCSGLKPGDVVVRPTVAYPTYDIGATFAGAEHIAADDLDELDAATRARVRLVWVNSPANPTGSVRDAESLRRIVGQARELGAVVASDECYAELGWGEWDVQRGGSPGAQHPGPAASRRAPMRACWPCTR